MNDNSLKPLIIGEGVISGSQTRGWVLDLLPIILPPPSGKPFRPFVAVDLLAVLLPGDVYENLTKPNPPIELLRELIRTMSPEERRQNLARVQSFGAYVKALEDEPQK